MSSTKNKHGDRTLISGAAGHSTIICVGKLLRSVFFSLIGLLILSNSAFAQDEFEKWLKQQNQEYQSFKEARDKEFAAMLKEAWEFMQTQAGEKGYTKPKVVEVPVADRNTSSAPPENRVSVAEVVKPIPAQTVGVEPMRAIQALPPTKAEARSRLRSMPLDLFGLTVEIPVDSTLPLCLLGEPNPGNIAALWEKFSATEYTPTLQALVHVRKENRMNDWLYGFTVENLATSLWKTPQERAVFSWFILVKSGFLVRLGYNEGGVYLLIPVKNKLFGTDYFILDNEKFYVFSFMKNSKGPGSLFTFNGSYQGATSLFDFSMQNLPKLAPQSKLKTLGFDFAGQKYSVEVNYSDGLIGVFDRYPQTDLSVYFTTVASSMAASSLVSALKPLLQGRTEREAVNMLLRFVQTAFAYKTDEDQFGREKYFFVEEVLHYPYSDCEDRSVLFAYLVRALLGNEVVGLKYPGHLATAVSFSANVSGDKLQVDGRWFVVCDPTYINADAGMTMPQFRDVSPTVIIFQ